MLDNRKKKLYNFKILKKVRELKWFYFETAQEFGSENEYKKYYGSKQIILTLNWPTLRVLTNLLSNWIVLLSLSVVKS